jgi:hypothetical protein
MAAATPPDTEPGAEPGGEPLPVAWAAVLAALPPGEGEAIHAVAFPIDLVDGTFRVGVRRDLWRARVREQLGTIDLALLVPGARRVEVLVEGEQGSTGREAFADSELRRRASARAAAEDSDALRLLLQQFGGELEDVAPSELAGPTEAGGPDDDPAAV